MIFQALVMSKLTFGAGSWQQMNIHTLRSWHTQVIKLYERLATRVHRGPGVFNLDIIAACRLPHPLLVLARERCSLFDRLMQTDMTEILAILQHQDAATGWFALVYSDVQQLSCFVPAHPIATSIGLCDIQQLGYYSCQHPQSLTRLCKSAVKVYTLYLDIWAQFRALIAFALWT